MFVGERMSQPIIAISPDIPIHDALNLFKHEHIRRAPVITNGKLIGIVSDVDLLNESPSPVSTLSIWEMNYMLSKINVSQVMTKDVLTVTEDTPIEEAARIMADNKIGGLPVMCDDYVVGIITETDIFKIFLEFMGAREKGVRVSALVEDKPGQLVHITKSLSEAGGNFVAFGQFTSNDPSTRLITFKVTQIKKEIVWKIIKPIVKEIMDIRY